MPTEHLDLMRPRRVHVVGAGGAGMSAIASVLAAMGHQVTGSDLKASPVTRRLGSEGIPVAIGHRAGNLGTAEVVTSSPAVPADNPELVEAGRRNIPVLQRSELLSAISALRRCIAVAGTHGKTTTASMLALFLVHAGLRPSFMIGAEVNEIGSNAVWDEGEWLVVEADESYGAFATLRPDVAVLTNVEADHLDHYGSFDRLREAFSRFLGGTSGPRVVGADDHEAASLGRDAGAVTVGTTAGSTYTIDDVALTRTAAAFTLTGPDGPLGRLEVAAPGLHNARNAALATVAGLVVGAPFTAAVEALARFTGVPRRFEFRGSARGVTFVDDYAHLPTEVQATLAAAVAGSWGRVVAVFQPHRYTRTAALASSFAGAFSAADVVFVTDVFAAGERPVPGVSGKLVADAVAGAGGPEVHYVPTREALRSAVAAELRPGDLCCTLGAGDLTSLPDELLAAPSW